MISNRVSDVWECALPDMGSLAMQRMLGRGMTINCRKVSCSEEEEFGELVGQRDEEQITFSILLS